MTLLYWDRRFLDHETGDHPEKADRIRQIPSRLRQSGLAARCRSVEFGPVDRRRLARIHSPAYIDEIWAYTKSGGGHIEVDTVISPASYDVALLAADAFATPPNASCAARTKRHCAWCGRRDITRWPNRAMGFCIFNNVAVGARVAVDELGLDRVLIVDWDVHHGNGTQAAFWEEPRVGFLSIHRWPFYPGTGDEDETGGGPGLGYTVNVPVEYGTPRRDYLALFRGALEDFAQRLKPQLIFISAGFDPHRLDPIGNLGLESEDFATMTRAVLDVAAVHAEGRVISVLEGGYNPQATAESVELHLAELLDSQPGTH
jgi:Deacetylases, including yeast histone deacetylase and acetoin utilization protein